MRLRTKTSILFAALVVGAVAINSEVLLHLHEESLRHSILNAARATAQSASETVASFLEDSLQDTQAIATGIPVDAIRAGDRAALARQLERALEVFPKFDNGLFILDAHGQFLADYPVHLDLVGKSFAHREYYQSTVHENKGVVGDPYHSARTGQPVLTFTAPIRAADGRLVAILAASMQLLSPRALGGLREQRLGETGYLYIFDTTRQMILHPKEERVLQRDVPVGANRLLDQALAGFEGVGETVNSKGVTMLAAVKPIRETRWILVSQQPASEAFAPVAAARQKLLLFMLLTLLIAVAFGLMAIRRLTAPLARLQAAAEAATRDLIAGAPVRATPVQEFADGHGKDEIAQLASAFGTLAGRLNSAVGTLRQSARDWQLTFDSVTDLVFVVDTVGHVVRANRVAYERVGRPAADLEGQSLAAVLFGTETEGRPDFTVEGCGELDQLTIAGEYDFRVTALVRDESETTPGFVCVLHDVSAARAAAKLVEGMAYYDALTGLPNRRLVLDRMKQAFRAAAREQMSVALMFIDLDQFKVINDTYGHASGDALLCAVARRITHCLRTSDTAGRFGGDEFVVVLENVQTPDNALAVAKKIMVALEPAIDVGVAEVRMTSSIGIAFYPQHGNDIDQVLAAADKALYEVKLGGRNHCRISAG